MKTNAMMFSGFSGPQEIPSPYRGIAEASYQTHISKGLTDSGLYNYFEACFEGIVEEKGLYACWVCPSCLAAERVSFGWGKGPDYCPRCGKKTYAVATFQAWAPATGEMFEWAFFYLMVVRFDIRLTRPHENLYDFILPPKTAIEAKGSPYYIKNPDGSKYELGRPGLQRSDTEKKAFANGKAFRRMHPDWRFLIVTNACPTRLRGYSNRDVTGVIDVSNKSEVESLAQSLTT